MESLRDRRYKKRNVQWNEFDKKHILVAEIEWEAVARIILEKYTFSATRNNKTYRA